IYFFLVPRLGATRMSQVNFAVPAGGALLGVLLLGEAMTLQRIAALAIIVGSVYIGTTRGRGIKA
ncbi:MAG: EamA family transporter, partial [Nitratireductor sp.]